MSKITKTAFIIIKIQTVNPKFIVKNSLHLCCICSFQSIIIAEMKYFICLSALVLMSSTGLCTPVENFKKVCADFGNSSCVNCLENPFNLTCKYVVQGDKSTCRDINAPLVTNATSITDTEYCESADERSQENVYNSNQVLGDIGVLSVPEDQVENADGAINAVVSKDNTTIEPPSTTDVPTTSVAPNTTVIPTTSVVPNTTITPTTSVPPSPTTTSPANTTTSNIPTTTTSVPTTTSTSVPTTVTSTLIPSTTVTTVSPATSTSAKPSPAPIPRSFDAASFFGGIVLGLGLIGAGFFGMKIYRRTIERSYHTL
ncbi:sialomucin core protein 24-like isoform X1 [Artemia franciscana]